MPSTDKPTGDALVTFSLGFKEAARDTDTAKFLFA